MPTLLTYVKPDGSTLYQCDLKGNPAVGGSFFKASELSCPCCNKLTVTNEFIDHLVKLREVFDYPMHPTSCARCLKHNTDIGGHYRSLHLMLNPRGHTGTLAIDISRHNMSEWVSGQLAGIAYAFGWSVGIADSFIHLDRRIDIGLPQAKFSY